MFGAALGGDYSLWVRTMKQLNWLPKIAINYCTGYQNPAVQKEYSETTATYFMGGMGFSPELAKKFMPEAIKVQDKYYTREKQPAVRDSDSIQESRHAHGSRSGDREGRRPRYPRRSSRFSELKNSRR